MAARSLASEIFEAALRLPGTEIRPSRFTGEPAVWAHGREILHLHHAREIDLRLGKREIAARREALRAHPRVTLRKASDWLEVGFTARDHLAEVLELVAVAVRASRR
jgi:hypothetical protein